MKKRFCSKALLILFIFFSLLSLTSGTANAAATCGDGTCDYKAGEDIFNCKPDCLKIGNATKDFTAALVDATDWILGFATAICVFMIIIGGFYYIFSTGDQEQATTGKKILKYALMGIVVVGISYALIKIIDTVL